MPLQVACPHCNINHHLDVCFAGKKIRCRYCKQPFAVAGKRKQTAAPAETPTPVLQAPPPAGSRPKDCGPVLVSGRGPKHGAETSSNGHRPRGAWIPVWPIATGLLAVAVVVWIMFLLMPNDLDRQLKSLKTGTPETRQQALAWLLEAEPQKADRVRVAAALEPVLFDDGDRTFNPELLLRTYLHWAGKDNVPTLIRMVANPTLPAWDARKAGWVIDALGKLQDKRAVDVLAEHLADPVLHDRAVNALRILGPTAEPAVLEFLFAKDADTRARAGQLLAEYGATPGKLVDEALGRLKSSQTEVRLSAACWFADNPPADEAFKSEVAKALIPLLDDHSPPVCNEALRALKLWATKDSSPQLRDYARRMQKAAFAYPDLIDVLAQFPDEANAEAIALQLANPGLRARAVQGLLKLDKAADKAILAYINDPDPGVQKEMQDLCRLLKIPADRQLEQTLTDLTDMDVNRSRAALQTLAHLRPDEASRAKVVAALNVALLDPNNAIREDALNAVMVWGSQENTTTLLKILGDFQTGGTGRDGRIIEALGSLKDPRAAQQLAQGLTHARERGEVSKALKAIGPGAEAAVAPFLQSPDPAVRITACRILADIGTDKSLQSLQTAGQMYYLDAVFGQETTMTAQKILSRK
jgi:HEAT repeat protein